MGEKIERILKTDLRSILNPNIWLLIVAIPHTLFGALVPMYQTSYGSNEFTAASFTGNSNNAVEHISIQ